MCDETNIESHFLAVGAETPAALAISSYTSGLDVLAATTVIKL